MKKAETAKKSFVLYKDFNSQLKELTDEQAGQYLKAIYSYQNGEDYQAKDPLVVFALKGVLSQFQRDEERYNERCNKNRENVQKRWESTTNKETPTDTTVCDPIRPNTKRTDRDRDRGSERESDRDREKEKDFERVWELYRRKGNKQKALRYWKKLSAKDRDAIEAKIPAYFDAVREVRYRLDFSGWINPTNRQWENELQEQPTKSPATLNLPKNPENL